MRVDPQRYRRVRVPEPAGDGANVDAGGDGLRGSEVTKVVEPGVDADLVSQAPVRSPEAVRQARL